MDQQIRQRLSHVCLDAGAWLAESELARWVKIADLRFNLRAGPPSETLNERYADALNRLIFGRTNGD